MTPLTPEEEAAFLETLSGEGRVVAHIPGKFVQIELDPDDQRFDFLRWWDR